jgi:hypothetical protein
VKKLKCCLVFEDEPKKLIVRHLDWVAILKVPAAT